MQSRVQGNFRKFRIAAIECGPTAGPDLVVAVYQRQRRWLLGGALASTTNSSTYGTFKAVHAVCLIHDTYVTPVSMAQEKTCR